MNKLQITDKSVEINIVGLDRFWSFKSKIVIPLQSIKKVFLRPKGMKPPWLRAPGTYVPKVMAAGTYYGSERIEFWNTRFNKECVVFELEDFDYTRVAVDVADAQRLIEDLIANQAVPAQGCE